MAVSLAGLRVLEVVPAIFSPPKKSSGMKTYALALRKHLMGRGLEVDVLGASVDGGMEKDLLLVRIPRKSDIMFSLCAVLPYLKLRNRYGLVHASDPFLTLPLMLALTKRPSVLTLHELWSDAVEYKRGRLAGVVARLVEGLSLRLSSRVIVVDEKIKGGYLRKYPRLSAKLDVVSIGVDPESFRPLTGKVRQHFGFREKDKLVVYLGRFEKEKNLGLLLHAFKHAKTLEPEAKLALFGDGAEKRRLEGLVEELGLTGVYFMDSLEQDSVPKALNCADVFALTSHYESCPLVAQEALACGVPVVSVDVGRVRQLVSDGVTGKVVSRDPQELGEALAYFLGKGREPKTVSACRKSVYSSSFKKTVDETLAVYEKALNGFPR